jgi:hypothetical protein
MKLSITSLPFARVKSPVWLRTILMFDGPAMPSSKPCLRLVAGDERQPCPEAPPRCRSCRRLFSTSHSPATLPSCTLSEVTAVRYRSSPAGSTSRSSSTTGILASLRFLQHRIPAGRDDGREEDRVHALRDEGADRLDLVLLLLLGVGDLKVMFRFAACGLETEVSAARQPDSDPICEKPTTLPSRPWAQAAEDKRAPMPAASASFLMTDMYPPRSWTEAPLPGLPITLTKVILYGNSFVMWVSGRAWPGPCASLRHVILS